MLRRDALALSMQIQTSAQVVPSTAGSRASTAGSVHLRKYASVLETKALDSVFMCSLLPDGRATRLSFVNSVMSSGETQEPKKSHTSKRMTKKNPTSVDANNTSIGERASSAPLLFHNSSQESTSAGNRALNQYERSGDSGKHSNLPNITKKNSIVTIDVNHGPGIFVPLIRAPHMKLTVSEDSGQANRLPTPPPPKEPDTAPNGPRPVPGARTNASVGKRVTTETESPLKDDTMLKLIDTTATLADQLGQEEVIKSPRQRLMPVGVTSPGSPKKKKTAALPYNLKPTAGDISRTMRDAMRVMSDRKTEKVASVSAEKGDLVDLRSSSSFSTFTKKSDYLDTDDYNVDDIVLVLNIRDEGNEAKLLLGALNFQHDITWGLFL